MCKCTTFSFHFYVTGHLDWFVFLAIVNDEAIKTDVHVSGMVTSSLNDIYQKVLLAVFFFFEEQLAGISLVAVVV